MWTVGDSDHPEEADVIRLHLMVRAMLGGVAEGVRTEREQKIRERLREEIAAVRKLQALILPPDF